MNLPEVYSRRKLNALYREIPLKDTSFRLLRKYFSAASNLYGIISLRKIFEIIDSQNPNLISKQDFIKFAKIAQHECEGYYLLNTEYLSGSKSSIPFMDYEIIDSTLIDIDVIRYRYLKKVQCKKPYYIPKRSIFILYADPFYYEPVEEVTSLHNFLNDTLHLEGDLEDIVYSIILFGRRCFNISFDTLLMRLSEQGIQITDKHVLDAFSQLFEKFCRQTRMQINRGHTPDEIALYRSAKNSIDCISKQRTFPIRTSSVSFVYPEINKPSFPLNHSKPGRNILCPCGSGKKYKYCCGR